MMRTLLAVLALMIGLSPMVTQATTQVEDVIFLDGQIYPLHTLPLEQYFNSGHPRPPLRAPHTAMWRGYKATWEIRGDRLFLKDLEAWTPTGKAGLEAVFPGRKAPIPATWFTGKLKIPQGKPHKPYVPYPLYAKYLIISVEKGQVMGRQVLDQPGGPGSLPSR